MATRTLDLDKVLELLRKYRPSLESFKMGGGIPSIKFLCPYHNDTNPSFIYTPINDKGKCFSCRAHVTLEQIIETFEHNDKHTANKLVEACYKKVNNKPAEHKAKTIDVSRAQIEEWMEHLTTNVKLNILMKKWGWTQEVIEQYMLGASEGRLTIPMYESDNLVGLKYYEPGGHTKYQNHPGSEQCCWPLANLSHNKVYLVEGEKDCLTMLSAGFNAVTFSTGAGSIPKHYIRFFAGKEVYVIYDIDEAGRKGAVEVAKTLNYAAKKVYIVDLPMEGIPKGDLTDAYIQNPEGFKAFIETICSNTDEYLSPEAVSRVVVPTEINRTYLEDIVKSKLFYRRVKIKVRVISNALHETTIVPRDVVVTCNRDYKEHLCAQCPRGYKDTGTMLHVKPEYPELLSMVGNNNKVQREAIRSMLEIIEGCTKFKVEQTSFQAIYPVVLIPAIEADKKTHDYSMVEAWALDVAAHENEDYEVEGVVLANPETQRMELVCYKMLKDDQSIDSFELTEDLMERLKAFQCQPQPSQLLIKN